MHVVVYLCASVGILVYVYVKCELDFCELKTLFVSNRS